MNAYDEWEERLRDKTIEDLRDFDNIKSIISQMRLGEDAIVQMLQHMYDTLDVGYIVKQLVASMHGELKSLSYVDEATGKITVDADYNDDDDDEAYEIEQLKDRVKLLEQQNESTKPYYGQIKEDE